jgi:hypothetical protein
MGAHAVACDAAGGGGGVEEGRDGQQTVSAPTPGPPTRAAAFTQLQEFLKHDVKNVLRMEHGGNYTAALLLLVGAEALSRIVDADDDEFFVEMLHRRGIDPSVAKDLFEALRHGLAHIFETKYVQVGKMFVELVVSWGELDHLSRQDPSGFILNVRTMWDDLKKLLAEIEEQLTADPEWAQEIPRNWKWVHQSEPKARAAWVALFGSA